MSEDINQLNERIDRNLREAHQQVVLREEFSAQLLSEMARETNRIETLPVAPATPWRVGWLQVATLAALVLVALFWGWGTMVEDASNHAGKADGLLEKEVIAQVGPSTKELQSIPLELPRIPPGHSVRAAEGYLEGKLYEDSQMEIYLVLPNQQLSMNFNNN